jgi:hypothetical protein
MVAIGLCGVDGRGFCWWRERKGLNHALVRPTADARRRPMPPTARAARAPRAATARVASPATPHARGWDGRSKVGARGGMWPGGRAAATRHE